MAKSISEAMQRMLEAAADLQAKREVLHAARLEYETQQEIVGRADSAHYETIAELGAIAWPPGAKDGDRVYLQHGTDGYWLSRSGSGRFTLHLDVR